MAKQTEVVKSTTMELATKEGTKALQKIVGNITELKTAAEALVISGIEDKAGIEAVDKKRKEVKSLRTAVENKRKELNSPALKYQKDVNAVAKELTEKITPIESGLEAKLKVITDEVERKAIEAARRVTDRTQQLFKRGCVYNGSDYQYGTIIISPDVINLGVEGDWQHLINRIDKAIEAVKAEEPIFSTARPAPNTFSTPAPPKQAEVPFMQPGATIGEKIQEAFRPAVEDQAGAIPEDIREELVESENRVYPVEVQTEYKGLFVEVYRTMGIGDSSNNGASIKFDRLLLIGSGIPQLNTETNPDKVVVIDSINIGATGAVTVEGVSVRIKNAHPVVRPLALWEKQAGRGMFGGNFVYSHDSRFPSGQPIAIHDRVE